MSKIKKNRYGSYSGMISEKAELSFDRFGFVVCLIHCDKSRCDVVGWLAVGWSWSSIIESVVTVEQGWKKIMIFFKIRFFDLNRIFSLIYDFLKCSTDFCCTSSRELVMCS